MKNLSLQESGLSILVDTFTAGKINATKLLKRAKSTILFGAVAVGGRVILGHGSPGPLVFHRYILSILYIIYMIIYYICFCMLSRVSIYLANGMPLTRLCLLAFL